jgi:hypothetical protein
MRTFVQSRALSCALVLGLAVVGSAAGCSEEKKPETVEADAGAVDPNHKQAVLGGKVAAAVKAAESSAPQGPKTQDGPPEKGIFEPGAADKVLAQGAAPKVDVLGEGSDPKISLAYAPSDKELRANVSAAFRMNGRGLPLDYVVSVKTEKPKDDKKPKDEKKDTGASARRVVVAIAGVTLPPQLPKEAVDQLGKVKGSEIKYTLSPSGVVTDASITLAKGADAGLDQLLQSVVEGITLLTPPLPTKPVGVGAYWMVTDRVPSGIVDVVRYRVFRVEKIEKDHVLLSVDVRQYAAKNEVDASGGQKLTMSQFESRGKGKVEWAAASLLPVSGEGQVGIALDGRVPSGQQGGAQTDLQIKIQAAEPAKK